MNGSHIKKLIEIEFKYTTFKEHEFCKEPTHDIDVPYFFENQTIGKKFKSFLGLLVRCNFMEATKLATQYILAKVVHKNLYINDPFDTYDFLMSQSEFVGVRSRFFIKTGASSTKYDNCQIEFKKLAALLNRLKTVGIFLDIIQAIEHIMNAMSI